MIEPRDMRRSMMMRPTNLVAVHPRKGKILLFKGKGTREEEQLALPVIAPIPPVPFNSLVRLERIRPSVAQSPAPVPRSAPSK